VTRRPFFNVEFLDSCHLAKTSHADGPTSRQIRLIFRVRKWPDALLAHYGSELSTWILHAITREERKVLELLVFFLHAIYLPRFHLWAETMGTHYFHQAKGTCRL